MNKPNYTLAAFQFDNLGTAHEFAAAASRLQPRGHLLIHDAVYVTSDQHGETTVTETTDLTTGKAAMSGALWGGLLGLVLLIPIAGIAIGAGTGVAAARLADTGITDHFIQSMRRAVKPGKTVLILLVSHINESAVRSELERYAGIKLVSSNLSDRALDVVRDAIKTDSEYVAADEALSREARRSG